MNDPLHEIAERRIQEAMDAGLFRGLPDEGKPLELDDLSGVPEELRAGYHVLRNARMLPEELELKRSLLRLDDLIAACHDADEMRELRVCRNSAALRFSILLERRGFGPAHSDYAEAFARRFSE